MRSSRFTERSHKVGRIGVVIAATYAHYASTAGVFLPFAAKSCGRLCAALALGASGLVQLRTHNLSVFGGRAAGETVELLAVYRSFAPGQLLSLSAVDVVAAFRRALIACFWRHGDNPQAVLYKTKMLDSESVGDALQNGAAIEFHVALRATLSDVIIAKSAGSATSAQMPASASQAAAACAAAQPPALAQSQSPRTRVKVAKLPVVCPPINLTQASSLFEAPIESVVTRESLARLGACDAVLRSHVRSLCDDEDASFEWRLTPQKQKKISCDDIDDQEQTDRVDAQQRAVVDVAGAGVLSADSSSAADAVGQSAVVVDEADDDDDDADDDDLDDDNYDVEKDGDEAAEDSADERKYDSVYVNTVMPIYAIAICLHQRAVEFSNVNEESVSGVFFLPFVSFSLLL